MAAVISFTATDPSGVSRPLSCGEVEVVEVFGLVDDGGRAHNLAVVVDEDVAHDGEYPSLEVHVLDVFVFVVEGLERGVLKKIVGVVAVGGKQISEVQEVALQTEKLGLEIFRTHDSCCFW